MLPDINVYKILEIIGTIAFASSGAMVAVKRRLDYLGIVVLGVTTAVGGGMCRDILIGQTPPGMFLDPTNTIIAFWTGQLYVSDHPDEMEPAPASPGGDL